MATRGVHLEIVTSLSTEQLLMAMKRFSNLRGTPSNIYSDNAAQFERGFKELKSVLNVTNNLLLDESAKREISWHFISPRAPHTGGAWERMVRTVKEALNKVLGKALLNIVELQTVVTEISGLVNDRPLVKAGSQMMDVITPSKLFM
ncbi:PREDICTED: uncharacterized protein LOC105679229, partial [Paramuricea clavata]